MRLRRLTQHCSACIIILLLHVGVTVSQSDVTPTAPHTQRVEVVLPVKGMFAFTFGPSNNVVVVDTQDGETQILSSNADGPMFWTAAGDKLAYRKPPFDGAYFDFSFDQASTFNIFTANQPNDVVKAAGWSRSAQNMLYLGLQVGAESSIATFYLYDFTNQSVTPLDVYPTRVPLANVPMPSGLANVPLLNITPVKRNPIWDEWVAVRFVLTKENPVEGTSTLETVNILWNLVTGQKISLDSLFDEAIVDLPFDWSADGNSLLVSTTSQLHIVSFNPDGTASIRASAVSDFPKNAMFFLDAGNLLIALNSDAPRSDADELVYSVIEISAGALLETEFFRLKGHYQAGDWHITASEEEKKTLSCTFDQMLPARLQVGERGRVAFTGGTPSRLRAEPGTDGAVLLQMPEGTAFAVLATPECRDGYRWWQLGLEDGIVGYAAEATTEEYFLEPVE